MVETTNTKINDIARSIGIDEQLLQSVISLTDEVKSNSYSPYSKFRVGSVLVTANTHKLIKGTNVENISYGLSNCAERSAIYSAVSNGENEFLMISVSSDLETFLTPCGACRQVIDEFKIKWVLLINKHKDIELQTIDYLLPKSPEIEHLKK